MVIQDSMISMIGNDAEKDVEKLLKTKRKAHLSTGQSVSHCLSLRPICNTSNLGFSEFEGDRDPCLKCTLLPNVRFNAHFSFLLWIL